MAAPSRTNGQFASNVCTVCRSQKRKCDKGLPRCSRCLRLDLECDYDWQTVEPQLNPGRSLSDFLLFHVPIADGQQWLPGTFQPLQPCWQNIQSRSLDIDQFFVRLVMTTLAEHAVSSDKVLNDYFENIHPWLPVIWERTLRNRLSDLECAPQAATALVFLIMFLLITEPRGCNTHDDSWNDQLYFLCSYLFSFLQRVQGPSIQLVQAGILLVLYEIGSGRGQEASLNIATCARMGYILQLNVDHRRSHEDLPEKIKAEEQRRVWLGVFVLDRLSQQVMGQFEAPHVVEDPSNHFRLPINDWELKDVIQDSLPLLEPSFITPIEIPLSYFAREVQGAKVLGQVQRMRRLPGHDWPRQEFEKINSILMRFMANLFEQTPGSWEVLCGANAIVLMTALILHRNRLEFNRDNSSIIQSFVDISEREESVFAVKSILNMIVDICQKFQALPQLKKIRWVPLPAVMCTGEAALAAFWLNQSTDGELIDIEPLAQTLQYAYRSWRLAGDYLEQISCGSPSTVE